MQSSDTDRWKRLKDLFNEVVDLDPKKRQEYLTSLGPEQATLFNEISQLLSADADAASFMSEPIDIGNAVETSIIGELIGNYRITREIGRGGMGAVFEAVREDGDFDQRVAIKLTGHNLFSDQMIGRFRNEKQILARLEHPNIVRLFDGGITTRHIPYYVMEYVEGVPITRHCRRRSATADERLRLFLHVLDAVSYAHRQLVVHRDLKPSNILVTADGEVKLLDFGIAKSLDADDFTQTLGAPLTPDYAAPEQLMQKPVTTASDIYSLGVLLFELLTDLPVRALYGQDGSDHLRLVVEKDPLLPSSALTRSNYVGKTGDAPGRKPAELASLARTLRGDLDNIILKCLQKDPDQRYASADQLSADIEAYLSGKPVLAHPESAVYRLGKFIRRNRLLVSSAAAAIVLILAGSGTAVYQSAAARKQQRIAEDRFVQVRKVANALIFDYHDEIAKLEGSMALREKLIADAISYLDAIAGEEVTDTGLLFELGVAYRKIGDVQGLQYSANLGKLDSAAESYQKSVASFAKVITIEPENLEAVARYADAARGLSNATEKSGFPKQARQTLIDAIATLSGIEEKLDHKGLITLNQLRIDEAVSWDSSETNLYRYQRLNEVVPHIDHMEGRFPNSPDNYPVRAVLESYRGNCARFAAYDADDAGDTAEAERLYRVSLVHYEAMKAANGVYIKPDDDPTAFTNLKYTYFSDIASSHAGLNEIEKATSALKEARSAVDAMLIKDKDDRTAQLRVLALARIEQTILLKQGRTVEALRSVEAAKVSIARLSDEDPTNIEKTVYGMFFCQRAAKIYVSGRDDAMIKQNQIELDKYVEIIHRKYGTEIKLTAYF